MTHFYLSFPSYAKIKEENGETIRFNFKTCMEYFFFCKSHYLWHYGEESNKPLEQIYYELKQLYR